MDVNIIDILEEKCLKSIIKVEEQDEDYLELRKEFNALLDELPAENELLVEETVSAWIARAETLAYRCGMQDLKKVYVDLFK